jgi:hypothetical protein
LQHLCQLACIQNLARPPHFPALDYKPKDQRTFLDRQSKSSIAALIGIISLLETITFVLNMISQPFVYLKANHSGASDLAKTGSGEIVSNVEWEFGKVAVIAICGVLGLGFLAKIVKRAYVESLI